MGFEECLTIQHRIHRARFENQLPDSLLLVEHPHVFTTGKRGRLEDLLVSVRFLRERGIPYLTIERGGEWTYHGPGQIVGYPIFSLRLMGIGVLDFVYRLEEVMILILKEYGIDGIRNDKNRGVWVGDSKVGFVGIAVKRGISLHGFSFNCNPDLSFFDMINPCGMKGIKVTSISKILGRDVPINEVKEKAIVSFQKVFDISLEKGDIDLRDFKY
jgi:lipoate-protein ligase B